MNKNISLADNISNWLNGSAIILGIAIGHQTGLFDTIQELQQNLNNQIGFTIEEIAYGSNLNKRYIQEWLGIMTSSGIIKLNGGEKSIDEGKYYLPNDHAIFLTKAGGENNMAPYCIEIPVLTRHLQDIIDCFKNGGGVGYEKQPEQFQKLMSEMSEAKLKKSLLSSFIPSVEGLVERLRKGANMLDIGCGNGIALKLLAEEFPNSKFVGIDIDEDIIKQSENYALQNDLKNLQFMIEDASKLVNREDLYNQFDYIYANDAIHDQAFPELVLQGANKVLKEDGLFSIIDINAESTHHGNLNNPFSPFLYTISLMYCMTVSLAQQGQGLGTMWGKQKAIELIQKAGFEVKNILIPDDTFNTHFLCRLNKAF